MGKRKSLASALKCAQEHEKKRKKEEAKLAIQIPDPSTKPRAKPLIPFDQSDEILFVGEGNFSFSASCIENHLEHGANVLSTSYDDSEVVHDKYQDAKDHIATVIDCCGEVLHGIDATRLDQQLRKRLFDVIIFCFPHVGAGIADEARNILTNQNLLLGFFKSAAAVLKPGGRIAVALAISRTYDLWDLKGIGKRMGYEIKTSGAFVGASFPGYEHRRTNGFTSENKQIFSGGKGEERQARWYIFQKRIVQNSD